MSSLDELLRALAAAPDLPPADPWIGARLGPLELQEALGAGADGRVYRARDDRLGRDVAVKILDPGLGADARERALREARAVAAIDHPTVVSVFDVGEQDGVGYVVTALAQGRPLVAPCPPRQVAALCAAVAEGLAHLHARGVAHGDLTAGNVLCTPEGQVKLIDFGRARSGEAGRSADMAALGRLLRWLGTGRADGSLRGGLEGVARDCAAAKPAAMVAGRLRRLARPPAWTRWSIAAGVLLLLGGALGSVLGPGPRDPEASGAGAFPEARHGKGPPSAVAGPETADPAGAADPGALDWLPITRNEPAASVSDLALSPSGRRLATIEPDGVYVHELDLSGRPRERWTRRTGTCVSFLGEERLVVSSPEAAFTVARPSGAGKPLARALAGCVRVSPDGQRAAVVTDRALRLVPLDGPRTVPTRTLPLDQVHGVAWAPSGGRLALVRFDAERVIQLHVYDDAGDDPGADGGDDELESSDRTKPVAGLRLLHAGRELGLPIHGGLVTWLDDDRLLVARRGGAAATDPPVLVSSPIAAWAPTVEARLPGATVDLAYSVDRRRLVIGLLREVRRVQLGRLAEGRLVLRPLGSEVWDSRPSDWDPTGDVLWVTRTRPGEGPMVLAMPSDGSASRPLLPGSRTWPRRAGGDQVVSWRIVPDGAELVAEAPGGRPRRLFRVDLPADAPSVRPPPWGHSVRCDRERPRCLLLSSVETGRQLWTLPLKGEAPTRAEELPAEEGQLGFDVFWHRDPPQILVP
ncbi:MAG TPA: serine/threonine-protein kinase, partial [Polyangiaceae bacterium LLY-WYZ-14_1]|nr:serine/threonine-protein kinase [Polyangiaceae bacterium LLY-WYZ-14_1]